MEKQQRCSRRSLWVLPLSCNDRSCLLPPQHHSVSDPKGPAALPPPPHPTLWVSAETPSGTGSQVPARHDGLERLLSPRAQGTEAAHQKFSVRCFTSSAKAGLLTFSLSHLPTGCPTPLPPCPIAPFNPLSLKEATLGHGKS